MWEIIVTAISSFIVSGGLTTLVCLKWIKKKSANEADSVAVETMKDAICEIRQSNDNLIEINRQLTSRVNELNEKIIELEKESSVAGQYICSRIGCSKRLPPRSEGSNWIRSFIKGEATVVFEE